MRVLVFKLMDWCVVIGVSIALLAVGFAHKTSSVEWSPELAAYIAAGGQLGEICGYSDEGDPVTIDCEACRIADNADHVASTYVFESELLQTRTYAFVAKRIAEQSDLDPARLTRAPPQA